MLLALLSYKGQTRANLGNLNNQIGVPLSLLEITAEDKYGVFELGASHKGDIDEIAALALPKVAILTNIAPAHLEFFKTLQGVFETKTEILKYIQEGGTLIYNADDEYLKTLKQSYDKKSLSYGFSENADLQILEKDNFAFKYQGGIYESNLVLQKHNKLNAGAAALAAISLGLKPQEVLLALKDYKPMALRLEEKTKYGVKFILDCYNANPFSMKNALDILAAQKGEKAAVLGDMRELGEQAVKYHQDLARQILALGIKKVFLVGPLMQEAYKILAQEPSVMVKYALETKDIIEPLKKELDNISVVLVKASNALNFEQIFKEI
jgi:UDP-N-acetylmuramoyl-tripeptide--D-alanyl-D-alanine ligase